MLAGKESIHGDIDAAQGHMQGDAGVAPGGDQAPVHGRNQQMLTASFYEMLFDFGEVIIVIHGCLSRNRLCHKQESEVRS
jgi:hypothetical protein